ncbi:hypothetical protein TURU_095528 [Turdus rufiventris]|nr:hypothetical protein TURU_095528 [Turdus rufiventris]
MDGLHRVVFEKLVTIDMDKTKVLNNAFGLSFQRKRLTATHDSALLQTHWCFFLSTKKCYLVTFDSSMVTFHELFTVIFMDK